MTLKEKFNDKSLHLDDLCNLLTKEITELSTEEYKLKLMFVLVHIIEESQKVLGNLDTNNLINELRKLVDKTLGQSEKQIAVQKLRHVQNKQVKDIIDGSNEELDNLDKQIESLLSQYERVLKSLVNFRNSLSLPEREVIQSQNK
jgi:archaellum component FlaC